MKSKLSYPKLTVIVAVVISVAGFFEGCMKERTETATKGRSHIVCDESVYPLFSAEKDTFEDLYPDAKLSLDTARSREAIVQFFNVDSTKVIATSRRFNDEELAVAKRTNLEYREYKAAINAIAVIAHPSNKATQIRMSQLDSVLRGITQNWKAVGGESHPIAVCLPDQNSGAFETVAIDVLHGEKYASPAAVTRTSAEMLTWVSKHPNGLGFVSANWLTDNPDSVKVLELDNPTAPDSLGIKGQFFSPHPAYVYQKFYPLTVDVYMYTKADIYSPGAGFIAFVISAPGQKIVQKHGLVPATMPVRLVQLNQKGS